MKTYKTEALIVSIGLIVFGYFVFKGLGDFSKGARIVSVKGLAEIEVPADKVTWPLVFKNVGNSLSTLHTNIIKKNQTIVKFLKEEGVIDSEISIGAPDVIDLSANRYNNEPIPHRYNVTSVLTVTSNDVKKIRRLILRQSELLKQGIAITGEDYRYRTNYSFTKLNEIKPKMIEEATENARAAAIKFAEDSESKLGKIRRANQGQFSISDRDNNTPYIKVVRVVTTIDYFLED